MSRKRNYHPVLEGRPLCYSIAVVGNLKVFEMGVGVRIWDGKRVLSCAANMPKKIFLNLYSTMTFRNFVVFPDGVVSKLADNPDIKLHVLIPKGSNFRELLSRYPFGKKLEVIEVNTKMPKLNPAQKLFYFFYSYLIFTGTTRLLATFGARADAPPAGGNRFFAPLKSAIANIFGRSKWIKTSFVPWAYKKLFSRKELADIFDRYQPDFVFLSGIAAFEDVELLAEAQRRKIKTMGMPMNWDHLNKYYIPLHPDRLLIQNQPMKKEAEEYHAYKESQIQMVGFPQFDFYITGKEHLRPRAEFMKKYGLSPNSKLILFISGSVYASGEQEILKEMRQWAKDGKLGQEVGFMVRPYPNRADIAKYKELEKLPEMKFFWEDTTTDLENIIEFMNILYHSDIVISIFSTTAIEAAIFDKPTITLGFDGREKKPEHQSVARLEKLSHFKHVLDTGGVRVARGFSDLLEFIAMYLESPEEDKEKRDFLSEKMAYKVDGKASGRVAEAIVAYLNE